MHLQPFRVVANAYYPKYEEYTMSATIKVVGATALATALSLSGLDAGFAAAQPANSSNTRAVDESLTFDSEFYQVNPLPQLQPFFPPTLGKAAGGNSDEGLLVLETVRASDTPWEAVESLDEQAANDLIAALEQNPRLSIDPKEEIQVRGYFTPQFWASIAEKTACVVSVGVSNCNKAANLAQKAQRDAEFRFPGRMHNGGPGDAFRHCWWSASMTTDINERVATIIGTNHERFGTGNSAADKDMDLYNNAQGRWAAVSSGMNWRVAVEHCDAWADNGILRVNVR